MTQEIKWTIDFDAYAEQAAVAESDARFRVVAAGRRTGKTTLAGYLTACRMRDADDGWLGYWVAPTHDIADTGFRLMDAAIPDDVIENRKLSPPREIELVDGPRLGFRTVSGGANVSVGLDWLVIDEAAKDIPEETWTQELRPTLSDRDGDALFISTPEGRDWFYDWWQRGQTDDRPDVESWQWSTYANPFVPDAEVDAARSELPPRIFEQQYLAEFDSGASLLTGDMLTFVSPDAITERELTWTVTADLGLEADPKKARENDTDYWAAAVVAYDSFQQEAFLVDVARTRGMTKDQGVGWLRSVMDPLPTSTVGIEANQAQRWFVQDAQDAGLQAYGIKNDRSKEERLTYLSVPFANEQVRLVNHEVPDDPSQGHDPRWDPFINEWLSFPNGAHDDLLDAVEMAVRQLNLGGSLAEIDGGHAYGDA